MAIKRVFNKDDKKGCYCLECGRKIEVKLLKDNKPYICEDCGQIHLVDIIRQRIALTKSEYSRYRNRAIAVEAAAEFEERIQQLEKELAAEKKECKEWQEAAEGLAGYIERIKKEYLNNENIRAV